MQRRMSTPEQLGAGTASQACCHTCVRPVCVAWQVAEELRDLGVRRAKAKHLLRALSQGLQFGHFLPAAARGSGRAYAAAAAAARAIGRTGARTHGVTTTELLTAGGVAPSSS